MKNLIRSFGQNIGIITALAVIGVACSPTVNENSPLPGDVTTVESAITDAQFWRSPGPSTPAVFSTSLYSCGSEQFTWREANVQYTGQAPPPGGFIRVTGLGTIPDSSINTSKNETKVVCPATSMFDTGPEVQSTTASYCTIYSHRAGEASFTLSVTSVFLDVSKLIYRPSASSGTPSGYWVATLKLPPGTLGTLPWGSGKGTSCYGIGGTMTAYIY